MQGFSKFLGQGHLFLHSLGLGLWKLKVKAKGVDWMVTIGMIYYQRLGREGDSFMKFLFTAKVVLYSVSMLPYYPIGYKRVNPGPEKYFPIQLPPG